MTLGEKGIQASDKTHFGRPSSMAFLPDGSFYVAEGGELRIYDTTTSKESTTALIDVVGKVEDILVIDK